ncbi:hypothetical protein P389DRAFT_193200 [Cystobasidium minutum MCA 4210]|uniref:uncharacterized protein n=1 Tax=Cystobasidium minutum MCA 4210 TaxID=1397322 RepID=UPI0034CEA55C|eukprot:jgi/Rhomi1/193200/gm1.1414_g
MASPRVGLDCLPTEILLTIARHLDDKRDVSNFSRLSRHLNASTKGVLFEHFSLDFTDGDWVRKAITAVDPDTWQEVTKIQVQIDLNDEFQNIIRPPRDAEVPTIDVNAWRTFLRMLPPLHKITVVIYLPDAGPHHTGTVLRLMNSPFWLDQVGLLWSEKASAPRLDAASLEIQLPMVYPPLIAVDIWRKLLMPLRYYRITAILLDFDFPGKIPDKPALLRFADAFAINTVQRFDIDATWIASSFDLIELLAKVTHLRVPITGLRESAWRCLQKFSSDLEHLELDGLSNLVIPTCEAPSIAEVRPPVMMSVLRSIRGRSVLLGTVSHLMRSSRLPALQSITWTLEVYSSSFTEPGLLMPSERIVQLRSLVNLDQALPVNCQHRSYEVQICGCLAHVRQCLDTLETIPSANLRLVLSHKQDDTENTSQEHLFDTRALSEAIPSFFRASVVTLNVAIPPAAFARPNANAVVVFDNLVVLNIRIHRHAEERSSLILYQFFSGLVVQKLATLSIYDESTSAVCAEHLRMLPNFLPLWPALQLVEYKSRGQSAYRDAVDATRRLQRLCMASGVRFKRVDMPN